MSAALRSGWGRAALIAAAFAAAGIALAVLLQPVHPVGDMAHYRSLGLSLACGRGYAQENGWPTAQRVPGYPLLQAGVYAAFGPSLQAVRLMQVLIAAATLLLIYGLAVAVLGDRRAALWAAGAAALYPATMFYAQTLLSETLFAFLLVAAVWCAVSARRGNPLAAAGAGALVGAAALTRPVGLILGPALALVVWWPRTQRRQPTLLLAAAALTLSPWVVRNATAMGRPILSDLTGGKNLLIGCNTYAGARQQGRRLFGTSADPLAGVTGEIALDDAARRAALAYLRGRPGRIAALAPLKLAAFWGLDRELLYEYREGYFGPRPWLCWPLALAGLGLAPLAGLALLGAASADLRAAAPLWAVVLALWLPHALLFAEPRFHFPLTPLLAVFAGRALARGRVRLPVRQRPGLAWAAAACALAAIWTADIAASFSKFTEI